MSGRKKKKIRPDLDGISTIVLLEKAAVEVVRLREENKRLAAELKKALKGSKAAAKKKVVAAEAEVEVAEKKARPRRQALGAGLARFLRARGAGEGAGRGPGGPTSLPTQADTQLDAARVSGGSES